MTNYNLTYRGVTCIGVDWEDEIFYFQYNDEIWAYPTIGYISFSADTDHIRFVIDGFLEFIMLNRNVLPHLSVTSTDNINS